jgi:2-methylcitrate dehydratase PrpD
MSPSVAPTPGSGPTLVQQLAAFAVQARDHGVPEDVARSARQRILDTIGVAVAAQILPTSTAALEHVAEIGGRPQAHAFGLAQALPAGQAAFANGVLAHSLDYDDTHLPSVLHPSASVVPAALAAAEAYGGDPAALTAAVAVGVEITVRLGMAGYDREAGNSTFFTHGQHATSICGAIGSAASAAMLMGADEGTIADAMGIAASFAGGIIEGNRTGGTVKRTHCGWAAQGGVTAAQLAVRGFTGPPTVFEGKFGFFEAFLKGVWNPAELTDRLGDHWEVPGIFFKPYPANHFTHAGADAAMALRAKGLRPEDVESIVLGVSGYAARTIGEPIEVKRAPSTGYQAQFSGPYMVSAALHGGHGLGLGLADFTDELAQDPSRRALMQRISVVPDAECDAIWPHQFPAVLTVRTKDGSELVEKVLANRGGPQRPLSDDELRTKFTDNVSPWMDPQGVALIAGIVEDPSRLGDLGALLAATVREG